MTCLPAEPMPGRVWCCGAQWPINHPWCGIGGYYGELVHRPVAGCIGPRHEIGDGWASYDWHTGRPDPGGVQLESSPYAPDEWAWWGYAHADDDSPEGPLDTEADALDWLWRHPEGEWIDVCALGPDRCAHSGPFLTFDEMEALLDALLEGL